MTLNQAFAIRVRELLKQKKMTQYRLEQLTGLYHSTMTSILNNRTKASNFKSMVLIIRELDIPIKDFFDSPVFEIENLEIDYD